MISRLRGTLLSRGEGAVEVETAGGVVYEVHVPLSVAERLPGPGTEVELLTHQLVREDLAALYGFLEAGEREVFRLLLKATRVGAQTALQMLSTFRAARLARAIAERDIAALVQAPGVGKKTAERLVLDLRDDLAGLDLGEESPGSGPATGAQAAVQALIGLGMSFAEADRVVRAALEEDPGLDTGSLIRRSLALR